MITVGLDVGKEGDPAALAALHTTGARPVDGAHRPAWQALDVGNIDLGTAYNQLAEATCTLVGDFTACGYPCVLTVDATGIGAAVVEHCQRLAPDLHLVAVTIGAGWSLKHTGPDSYTVGKYRLTEVVQVALQQQGLRLPDSDGAALLSHQLGAFVRKPQSSGYVKHEADGSGHDDLVSALSLALWTGDTLHDQAVGVAP